jgi:hypothetical protein
MIRVVHPGSQIRMLTFSHPGFRIQGSKRHPIPDLDPQHWKKLYFMYKFICVRPQKAAETLETPLSTPSVTANGTVLHLAVSKSRDVSKAARVVSADKEAHVHEEGNPWPYMTDFYKFITRKAVFRIRDVMMRIRTGTNRLRGRIRLFSSVAFKSRCQRKYFFAFYLP